MTLVDQKIQLIKADVESLETKLSSFVVKDEDSLAEAAEWLGNIKARIKRVDALRKEFVGPLNEQVKKINNMFKMQLEPLQKLEHDLKATAKKYMDEQERKAQEAAERLRKEQEAKEKAELEKIAAARAEEERLRKEAEEAKNKKEKAKLEKEAEAAKKAQEEAEAAMMEQPEVVEAPKTSVRASSGVTTRKKVWKWKVTDEDILRKTHPELFILDEKAVNKMVKGGTRQIAGIDIYEDSQLSVNS